MPSDFLQQMTAAGLAPAMVIEIANDGLIHRYQVEGDQAGSLNGWYICFGDCMVAGSWRTGQQESFYSGAYQALSFTERHRLKLEREQMLEKAYKARLATEMDVAATLQQQWDSAPLATIDHPYLVRKKIPPHDLRQQGNRLLIPVRDCAGRLWSIQYIAPNGTKRFATGDRVKGGMHLIGEIADVIVIAEGFATAAALHIMTGQPIVTAFNAGNLKTVAQALRENFSKAKIIIAADNDRFSPNNIGVTKAKDAAKAVGAQVIIPQFSGDVPGTDYSDIYLHSIRTCNDET